MTTTMPTKPQLPTLYTIHNNHITVELCTTGASITRILFPPSDSSKFADDDPSTADHPMYSDDVVLHCVDYSNASCKNEAYFGAVVGRVANRIKGGTFELNGYTYHLMKNDGGLNCLHGGGGDRGFSHCQFQGKQLDDRCVVFTLMSKDGHAGFPGCVCIEVIYRLGEDDGILSCDMKGTCANGEALMTPLNLAQHSYFNLAGHDSADGILSHSLYMPMSSFYTPIDANGIPTREVRSLDDEKTMDFRSKRMLNDALESFGVSYEGLDAAEADEYVTMRKGISNLTTKPFGFDHNYVISENQEEKSYIAGVLEHSPSGRRMTVKTNMPGVQIYTSNYLDGSILGKENVKYEQWQGICLETQYYPDSICADDGKFSDGACFILKPGGTPYIHSVSYTFEHI